MKIVFIYDGLYDRIYEVTIPEQTVIKKPGDPSYYVFSSWSHPDSETNGGLLIRLKDTFANADKGDIADLLVLPERMVLLD